MYISKEQKSDRIHMHKYFLSFRLTLGEAHIPHVSYTLTEPRIACLQTGHFGARSRSTENTHLWQQTRCPHGINAHRLLLMRQITHNCPSGISPISSSSTSSDSGLLLPWLASASASASSLARICLCSLLRSHHCFHLTQFLKRNKKKDQTDIRCQKKTLQMSPLLKVKSKIIIQIYKKPTVFQKS